MGKHEGIAYLQATSSRIGTIDETTLLNTDGFEMFDDRNKQTNELREELVDKKNHKFAEAYALAEDAKSKVEKVLS